MHNYVIVSRAKDLDFQKDCVKLPQDYGKESYYSRREVKEIEKCIACNLSLLNKKTGFLSELEDRPVIIKPNLVTVFHDMGFKERDYPETTDPRVIGAIIGFIEPYAKKIYIGESSGRGMPTDFSFKNSGLERLKQKHDVKLVALEEQPVKRYILPKAEVMKEILIPKLYNKIIEDDAYYISVPKTKTNLYTGVTLGFKNAMGVIPYNLRQRNHNYRINEKLVDMLYILKPDLTIIDGIVGGEGNTPAPVDPVNSRLVISGTNSVETDRVATRLMGFDPEKNKLIKIASNRGFGDKNALVLETGSKQMQDPENIDKKNVTSRNYKSKSLSTRFRAADPSLLSDIFQKDFPNVTYLIGFHKFNMAPILSLDQVDHEYLKELEKSCSGGCIPAIRTAFDYVKYQSYPTDFKITILMGNGVKFEDKIYYFDREGHKYTKKDIKTLPGKKLAMGTCTQDMADVVDDHLMGCMPKPGEPVIRLFSLIEYRNKMIYPHKNKTLLNYGYSVLRLHRIRKKLIKEGKWLDCEPPYEDKIFGVRELSEEERTLDYIPWPLPKMTNAVKKMFLEEEKLSVKDFI